VKDKPDFEHPVPFLSREKHLCRVSCGASLPGLFHSPFFFPMHTASDAQGVSIKEKN
jgi:hypothetical protein